MIGRLLAATPLRKRLATGFAVNAIGRVWVLIVQVLSIPVLTTQWGAHGFGVWLMLSTVPAYFALGGYALGNVAATDMLRRLSAGDRDGALSAFQSGWVLISGLVGVLALGLVVAWAVITAQPAWLSASRAAIDAAALLGVYSIFAVQANTLMLAYRAIGRYAEGTARFEIQGLAEGLAVVAVALMGGGFPQAALAMLAIRAAGCAWLYAPLRRSAPWLRIGVAHVSIDLIRALIKPALASLSLMLSNALSLQGVLLTLGFVVSPAATAAYSAARTICRIPVQACDLVTRATLPELTTAVSSRNVALFERMTRLNIAAALAIALPSTIALGLFGPDIAERIGAGALGLSAPLFAGLGLAALAQSLWQAIGQSLQATNEHHLFAGPVLACAALLAATPLLLTHDPTATTTVAFAAAACDIALLAFVAWRVWGARPGQTWAAQP